MCDVTLPIYVFTKEHPLKTLNKTGFYLSFWSAVMKIYPFATLYSVNKDESM